MKTLEELEISIAELQKEYQTVLGGPHDIETPTTKEKDMNQEKLNHLNDIVYRLNHEVYSYASQIHEKLMDYQEKHKIGHLPPLNHSQMSKALDSMGCLADYEVQKHYITTASKNGQTIIEAEMP